MRKIVLTANDFELFDTEIGSVEYEFFHKHKDAFKRMWIEQGQKFWVQFVMSYRQYAVDYGTIKEFPAKNEHFEDFVDQAFIVIHENFVEGKFGSARSFITDTVLVAQNRHTLQYLESKSFSKDPFYSKDTRDVFRRLFGPPNEKSSYLKVYILFPIYMKFAGAVCICLKRWLDAEDISSDEDIRHLKQLTEENEPIKTDTLSKCSTSNGLTDSKAISDVIPKYGPRITEFQDDIDKDCGKDTKKTSGGDGDKDTKAENSSKDSKETKTAQKANADKAGEVKTGEKTNKSSDAKAKSCEDEEEMEVIMTKGVRDIRDGGGDRRRDYGYESDEFEEMDMFYREFDDRYRHYDEPYRMRKEMMRRRMMMEERRMERMEFEDEFFTMYIEELKDGNKQAPANIRDWPRGKDPRTHDPDNPLYDPRNKNSDWKEGLKLPDFARFVKYVRKHYKRGRKITDDDDDESYIKKKMKEVDDLKNVQMEENLARTLREKLFPDEDKHNESQEEKKRKRKIRKKIKKGLPVSSSELASAGKKPPTPKGRHITVSGGSADEEHLRVALAKAAAKREDGFPSSGLYCLQLDDATLTPMCTPADPRKPYIMEQKKQPTITPKHVEPQLVQKRKDMDPVSKPEKQAQGMKVIKEVDQQKGTMSVTVESVDKEGNKNIETTIKPIDGDMNVLHDAMAKMHSMNKGPLEEPPTFRSEVLAKHTAERGSDTSMTLVRTSTNSTQTSSQPMAEADRKQFTEMYSEIASAIGDVSRQSQFEDDPKKFMCNHDPRNERARNRLRRKVREQEKDRKDPDLPGIVRLSGQIEYPRDENEAMMYTLAEMTKMNAKEKELFQEKLGRTKYFKNHEDPRDVVDSMNQFLVPGIKDTLKDEKSKAKKAMVREKEKKEFETRTTELLEISDSGNQLTAIVEKSQKKDKTHKIENIKFTDGNATIDLKSSLKKKDNEKSKKTQDQKQAETTKTTLAKNKAELSGKESDKENISGSDSRDERKSSEETVSIEDLKQVMEYKEEVRRMKIGMDYSSKKMKALLKKDDSDTQKTKEFLKQVVDANRELRSIEDRLSYLDSECQSQADPKLRHNVINASEELERIKTKVKKWERDAEYLAMSLSKYEREEAIEAELMKKRLEKDTEESVGAKKPSIDTTYDTHPPGHPEVTDEIIKKSENRAKIRTPSSLEDLMTDLQGLPSLKEKKSDESPKNKPTPKKEKEKDSKNGHVGETVKSKPKSSTKSSSEVKDILEMKGMTSYKLSHPVGGRVADNRSPQQREQDAERFSETTVPTKAGQKSLDKKKRNNTSVNRDGKSAKDKEKSSKSLKVCANCGKTEPGPKTFKKCQKCKEDQIKNSRYYCGKDCQGEDWHKRHKTEHKEKTLT